MEYAFDVWVNWTEGNVRSYEIPHYYEWENEDNLTLMGRLPIVVVEPDFYDHVEDGLGPLPEKLLEHIYGQAQKLVNKRPAIVQYAMLITDGKRILAVDAGLSDEPLFKSRLLSKQEDVILHRVRLETIMYFDYEKVAKTGMDETILDSIQRIDSEYMLGLTKIEREMKVIVFDCLYSIASSDHLDEVIYWCTELFPDMEFGELSLRKMGTETLLIAMRDFIREGWTDRHEAFGSALVEYYTLYKNTWTKLVQDKYKPVTS